jgi:hypothetical protein
MLVVYCVPLLLMALAGILCLPYKQPFLDLLTLRDLLHHNRWTPLSAAHGPRPYLGGSR